MHKIISSGSHGNAVLYNNSILVDIGVSYKLIEPYKNDIQIVLLTHEHQDHINYNTIEKLLFERPSLRIGCDEYMADLLTRKIWLRQIDVYKIGCFYDYGIFKIQPIKLYHDVPNVGYKIHIDEYKIIHATDTAHLNGIEAKDYDLFAIEHNYNEETIHERIEQKEANGEFAYQKGSVNSHLSEQQAKEFIFKNRKPESKVIRLHESKSS